MFGFTSARRSPVKVNFVLTHEAAAIWIRDHRVSVVNQISDFAWSRLRSAQLHQERALRIAYDAQTERIARNINRIRGWDSV